MRLLIIILLFSICACNSQSPNHGGSHLYTNALANESSPYLLQHAHNPVNWYPWGEDALAKAQKEDKLLIISVGYAACHWCHVMEHESFEDTAVAKIMNEHFVNIKVDREERPDVDEVYMAACQLSSGRGCGWPLNAIALPDGRPVWAGTYFPKKKWVEVLEYFIKSKNEEGEKMEEYAAQLQEGIKSQDNITFNGGDLNFTREKLDEAMAKFQARADGKKGGIRTSSPKFPMPTAWEFALKWQHYNPDPKTEKVLYAALDNMAMGGIYDHLGGGFSRYSVDDEWHVPHFEKMLYDNGPLVSLYSHAYQLTKNPMYQERVVETLNFIERELMDELGGFYSSLDADSEGEEGKFYVWKKSEIDSILNDETASKHFAEFYDIKTRGNWEHGNNVLIMRQSAAKTAEKLKVSEAELITSMMEQREKLLKARASRIRPGLDDKVLTSWNGLMLKGYCDAYRAIGNEHYRKVAIKNGEFLLKNMMQKDGRLNRNYKDGKSVINAFLDDYANAIQGFVALYEITFDEKWLKSAEQLANYAITHFKDEKSGMFFFTSNLDPELIARKMELTDSVIPASNSTMARGLYALGTYLYKEEWRETATQMLHNMTQKFDEGAEVGFYANWFQFWLDLVNPPYEVAIVGDNHDAIRKSIAQNYIPNALLLGGKNEGSLELLEGKLLEGETMIYVCQNKVCKLPVTEVDKALELF